MKQEENKYHKDLVLNAGKMTQTSLNAVNQIINNLSPTYHLKLYSKFSWNYSISSEL